MGRDCGPAQELLRASLFILKLHRIDSRRALPERNQRGAHAPERCHIGAHLALSTDIPIFRVLELYQTEGRWSGPTDQTYRAESSCDCVSLKQPEAAQNLGNPKD